MFSPGFFVQLLRQGPTNFVVVFSQISNLTDTSRHMIAHIRRPEFLQAAGKKGAWPGPWVPRDGAR